jgi:hypothetical protein
VPARAHAGRLRHAQDPRGIPLLRLVPRRVEAVAGDASVAAGRHGPGGPGTMVWTCRGKPRGADGGRRGALGWATAG